MINLLNSPWNSKIGSPDDLFFFFSFKLIPFSFLFSHFSLSSITSSVSLSITTRALRTPNKISALRFPQINVPYNPSYLRILAILSIQSVYFYLLKLSEKKGEKYFWDRRVIAPEGSCRCSLYRRYGSVFRPLVTLIWAADGCFGSSPHKFVRSLPSDLVAYRFGKVMNKIF